MSSWPTPVVKWASYGYTQPPHICFGKNLDGEFANSVVTCRAGVASSVRYFKLLSPYTAAES